MHKRNNVADTSPILGSARPHWAALDGGRAIGRSNLGRVASQANWPCGPCMLGCNLGLVSGLINLALIRHGNEP